MNIGDIVRIGEREIPMPALKPSEPQEPAPPSPAPEHEREPEPREPERNPVRREPEKEPERHEPEWRVSPSTCADAVENKISCCALSGARTVRQQAAQSAPQRQRQCRP
jgi:hypothetical protein